MRPPTGTRPAFHCRRGRPGSNISATRRRGDSGRYHSVTILPDPARVRASIAAGNPPGQRRHPPGVATATFVCVVLCSPIEPVNRAGFAA